MITFKNIEKTYILGDQHWTFGPINLEIPMEDTVAIIGHSGSGKSTLLHILGSLDTPDTGKILVDGKNIEQLDTKQKDDFRNNTLGFVFQDFYLFPELTVFENIKIMLNIQNSKNSEEIKNKKAHECIQNVGLQKKSDHHPSQLSGGQKQRVAIARALVHTPKLLLADEPTGNLDRKTGGNIWDMLFSLVKKNTMGFWCVTHDENILPRFDWIITVEDGKIASCVKQ